MKTDRQFLLALVVLFATALLSLYCFSRWLEFRPKNQVPPPSGLILKP